MHYENGSWWAECPEIAGITVIGSTLGELRKSVHEAIHFHFDSAEEFNFHEFIDSSSSESASWIVPGPRSSINYPSEATNASGGIRQVTFA